MKNRLRALSAAPLRSLQVALIWLILASCSTSQVYIVRHAEKRNESDTSSLTPAGQQRALALARELASVRIDSVLTTPYRRTQLTAAPLAEAKKLPVVTYSPSPTEGVAKRVLQMRGKNVLVVGHSNTILEIARALGTMPSRAKIESGDFDNLLQVTIRRGPLGRKVTLVEKTYGAPTAP